MCKSSSCKVLHCPCLPVLNFVFFLFTFAPKFSHSIFRPKKVNRLSERIYIPLILLHLKPLSYLSCILINSANILYLEYLPIKAYKNMRSVSRHKCAMPRLARQVVLSIYTKYGGVNILYIHSLCVICLWKKNKNVIVWKLV